MGSRNRPITVALNLVDGVHRNAARVVCPFYARYPYSGGLPFPRADARGAVSTHDRFFYNRIPKVANSTITSLLANGSARRRNEPPPTFFKTYFPRPSKLSAQDLEDFDTRYFSFVFVRNPFERTLSAFLDKIVRSRGEHPAYRDYHAMHRRGAEPTFGEFCEFLRDGGLRADPHWAPQTDCLLLPLRAYDFIGRFETLAADLETIAAKLFPETSLELPKKGPRTGASAKVKASYSTTEIEIVRTLYAQDFEAFDYATEIPA